MTSIQDDEVGSFPFYESDRLVNARFHGQRDVIW
jgi:hypothetical protein